MQRLRGRDVATGIVLGFATGLSALFLYLDTTKSATTGVSQQILFGSIFTLDPSTIPLVVVMSVARPWRSSRDLSTAAAELDQSRSRRRRAASEPASSASCSWSRWPIAVGLSSIAIGSILSTALLIGPAATALRVTKSLRAAFVWSSVLGVVATWLGVLLAYNSYYWFPSSQGLPVSFFIVVARLRGLPRLGSAGAASSR